MYKYKCLKLESKNKLRIYSNGQRYQCVEIIIYTRSSQGKNLVEFGSEILKLILDRSYNERLTGVTINCISYFFMFKYCFY